MASPNQSQNAAPSTQPLTPPAEPSNTTTNASSQQQPATGSSTTAPVAQPTQVPSTSLKDSGKSRRPRDVRLIHMLLSSLGVTAYQERVPLQLLDFAYRYTSGVLQDAVHLATEGYAGAMGEQAGSSRGPPEVNTVSLPALRLSIASRLHYQFQTGLPKEFLMDVAAERNRVALPGATRGYDQGQAKPAANQSVLIGGMRLPPERFCLTGVGWNMKDEWESEGEEEVEEEEPKESNHAGAGGEEEGDGGEDDEDGKMEDIFGEDAVMGDRDDDGDKDMTDV
ncbi:TATA Binding Protein TBP Associated Factor 9 [Aspergillus parasiticus SU-1]|uniref:Transcription initiation factor IID, 31kD subunit-domain-containing protein n=3 Tax=Aspergillus subgen. Circumdati TaxID=2720871 RepID=A0A5N6DGU4_ASPPA|nr:transcription initiation factor IID, 31kD subunit-domain-containing protein [Aspergillus parasiticus]KAE8316346.1 transcription initiation factor IID, 31kD subunit-domain-containing protein [Aspergillus transmontanensis]KJK64872.1 TATA Binding Protein TBP Associated Factor 9 [Aspergillus parasiticus SU-1]